MSEQQPIFREPADTLPDDDREAIKIDREVLEASRTPEGQALYEYGGEYEKELKEEGLIHP
jgi:hypothetical protein